MGWGWRPAHTLDMDNNEEKSAYDLRTEELVRKFNQRVHEVMHEAREDIVATLREPRVIFY